MHGEYIESMEYISTPVNSRVLMINLKELYRPYLIDEYYCDHLQIEWEFANPYTYLYTVHDDNLGDMYLKEVNSWGSICSRVALRYIFLHLV